LDQVKNHLRIDYTNDDQYIQSMIGVATAKAERFLRRRLVTQTWKVFIDHWPDGDIVLPFGKLQSVTHVKYTDTAGTQTTWTAATYYTVDTDSDPGRIKLRYGQTYPSPSLAPDNPIEIQFVCGYGAHAVQTITAASNASPIVVTIAGHGYTTGDTVYIYGTTGNTATNGTWIITKVTDNTFSLNGSTGNAAWVSGGSCVKQAVPQPILQGMYLYTGDLYENREDIIVLPGLSDINRTWAAKALLTPHILWEEPSA